MSSGSHTRHSLELRLEPGRLSIRIVVRHATASESSPKGRRTGKQAQAKCVCVCASGGGNGAVCGRGQVDGGSKTVADLELAPLSLHAAISSDGRTCTWHVSEIRTRDVRCDLSKSDTDKVRLDLSVVL